MQDCKKNHVRQYIQSKKQIAFEKRKVLFNEVETLGSVVR